MRAALVTVLILIAGIVGLLAQTGPGALNIYYIPDPQCTDASQVTGMSRTALHAWLISLHRSAVFTRTEFS